jgi:hypothetical protein
MEAVIDPFLFEAMPCARLPALTYGVAPAPDLFIEWHWGPDFTSNTSPFQGVQDVYDVVRIPVEGWRTDQRLIEIHSVVTDHADSLAAATRKSGNAVPPLSTST